MCKKKKKVKKKICKKKKKEYIRANFTKINRNGKIIRKKIIRIQKRRNPRKISARKQFDERGQIFSAHSFTRESSISQIFFVHCFFFCFVFEK